MIRYYATDGDWQSGNLSDFCESKLQSVYVPTLGINVISLPNSFTYTYGTSDMYNYDLGGNWYPHFVTTVIYSGKMRPIK